MLEVSGLSLVCLYVACRAWHRECSVSLCGGPDYYIQLIIMEYKNYVHGSKNWKHLKNAYSEKYTPHPSPTICLVPITAMGKTFIRFFFLFLYIVRMFLYTLPILFPSPIFIHKISCIIPIILYLVFSAKNMELFL